MIVPAKDAVIVRRGYDHAGNRFDEAAFTAAPVAAFRNARVLFRDSLDVAFAADLGLDKVLIYRFDPEKGTVRVRGEQPARPATG